MDLTFEYKTKYNPTDLKTNNSYTDQIHPSRRTGLLKRKKIYVLEGEGASNEVLYLVVVL